MCGQQKGQNRAKSHVTDILGNSATFPRSRIITGEAGVRLGSAVTKVLVCGKCGQSPPLPSPPLPSPPLPSPPLPSPPLPSPPACQIWSSWVQPFGRNYSPPKLANVAPPWRSASGHEGFPPCWSSRGEKCCFENVELRELWFESGLMNGPLHTPQGRWSECHRVRNAKRPREGSSSRTASYY